jgi:hypothetical protein
MSCSILGIFAADDVVTYRDGERSSEILRIFLSLFKVLQRVQINAYVTYENFSLYHHNFEKAKGLSDDAGWAIIPSLKKWTISANG